MTDYRCPSCEGGFPEGAHDDACPWCGETMSGSSQSEAMWRLPIDPKDPNPRDPPEPEIGFEERRFWPATPRGEAS